MLEKLENFIREGLEDAKRNVTTVPIEHSLIAISQGMVAAGVIQEVVAPIYLRDNDLQSILHIAHMEIAAGVFGAVIAVILYIRRIMKQRGTR